MLSKSGFDLHRCREATGQDGQNKDGDHHDHQGNALLFVGQQDLHQRGLYLISGNWPGRRGGGGPLLLVPPGLGVVGWPMLPPVCQGGWTMLACKKMTSLISS